MAITAAAATGVILALLAGFFIGRGTRLSNSEAQDKITQQAQADQIQQQRAIDAQVRSDQAARDRAAEQARGQGYQSGLTDQAVKDQAQSSQQYQSGLTQGQQQGQQQQQQQDAAQLAKLAFICSQQPTPVGC